MSTNKEYTRYYGGFRGVDFSTDETLVASNRFPYAVNVYKNYSLGSEQGVETIAGFRRRVEPGGKIYGIHHYRALNGEQSVLIHAGGMLYRWVGFGSEDESEYEQIFSGMLAHDSTSFVFNNRLYILDGNNYIYYDGERVVDVKDEAYIPTTYINIVPGGDNEYEGREYEQRNILQPKFKHTYIADGTTKEYYLNEANIDFIAEIKVYGTVLSSKDYSFSPGESKVTFNEAPGKPEENDYPEFYAGVEITAVKEIYDAGSVRIKSGDGTETTMSGYTGESEEFISLIESATVVAVFDNRVFFSGISGKPNLIFYTARNSTGYADPSYIGILNYMEDGVDNAPITAMLPVANSLLVLKADTHQDGTVYYHAPYETGLDIIPKIYPSESGLAGTGCLGAAVNFLDDPVFVSKYGLEAIGQLSVRYERAREHRSTLVDAKLVQSDLSRAKLCVYAGYLLLLVDGKIFMADSRQAFTGASGVREYEWFYLEEIGIYDGQHIKYEYMTEYPLAFINEDGSRKDITVTYNGRAYPLSLASDDGFDEDIENALSVVEQIVTISKEEYRFNAAIFDTEGGIKAYALISSGEMIGGIFSPARCITTIDDNVYFGTENGIVCSFNFDKRSKTDGLISPEWYTFDGRTIYSGVALRMDNCDIPHLTKTTIKKSTVAKVQSYVSLAAKVRVLTNNNPAKNIDRISAHRYLDGLFSSMDFSDFSFVTTQTSLFLIREKEKKWVEKQYYIYSDEYQKPFALIYLAYRYKVVGAYKH